jgi:hypothetical protein
MMTERKRPPRPGEGRPKLFDEETADIVVEMPQSLAKGLTALAKRREQTRSSLIRSICRDFLQTQGETAHVLPS